MICLCNAILVFHRVINVQESQTLYAIRLDHFSSQNGMTALDTLSICDIQRVSIKQKYSTIRTESDVYNPLTYLHAAYTQNT